MAINKVAYGDQTLLDLTEDTVTADKVLEGETFHDKSGVLRSGNLVIPVQDVEVNGESVVNAQGIAEVVLDEYVDKDAVEEKSATDEFTTINGGLLSECKVALSPNQDLHGYPEPWVGGAEKNKLPLTVNGIKSANTSGTWSGNVYTQNNMTFEIVTDSADNIYGIKINGTNSSSGENVFFIQNRRTSNFVLPADSYYINGMPQNAPSNASLMRFQATRNGELATLAITTVYGGGALGNAQNGDALQVTINILGNATVNNLVYQPMLRKSTEADYTFEPYSNICPISGHTQVDVDVSDGQTTQEQVTVNLGGTYYSGTLDVVSGVFIPDTAGKDLSTLTFRSVSRNRWLSEGIISEVKHPSSSDLKIKFWSDSYYYTNAVNLYFDLTLIGIAVDNEGNLLCRNNDANPPTGYIVYELATPTPIQLSPTMVKALVGENHLSAPLEGQEITESKYRELFTWDEVEDYVNAHSGGGSGMNYSTEEQVVGTWIDNKPLYAKTIVYTPSGTISSNTTIANVPNAKVMRVTEATAYNSSENRGYTLPDVRANGGTKITYDDGNVTLEIISDSWSSSWTFYVTVQYTKTTD